MTVLLYIHLVAAMVFVGGLIVVAALIPAARSVTDDRKVIQALARRFGVVSWVALTTLVLTGTTMVMISFNWSTTLTIKVSLVASVTLLSLWHTLAARDQTPRTRGMIQGLILILALVIVGVALNI